MKDMVSIYIDGFNFYYAAIRGKGSQYYYPSLKSLCNAMLRSFNADYEIKEIHYFTARVKSTSDDPTKEPRQKRYLTALQKEGIIRHLGKFNRREKPPKEKQTDVNITVQMLNDAWENKYTHGVLLSSDSDFVELLRTIRDDRGIKVGVWYAGDKPRQLAENANYVAAITRKHIQDAPQIANKDFQRQHNRAR